MLTPLNSILTPLGRGRPLVNGASDITNGLVGWWKFNETSGTTAADSSGNGYDFGITGATWVGEALSFSETDYLSRNAASATAFNFDHTTPFSCAMWINPDNTTQVSYLINKRTGAGNFEGWICILNGNRKPHFQIRKDGTHRLLADATNDVLIAGVWQHVVFTFDGSNSTNGVKMYYNGAEIAVTATVNSPLTSAPSNTAKLMFGINDAFNFPYSGDADDIRIYNRALSSTEISTLYANGAK